MREFHDGGNHGNHVQGQHGRGHHRGYDCGGGHYDINVVMADKHYRKCFTTEISILHFSLKDTTAAIVMDTVEKAIAMIVDIMGGMLVILMGRCTTEGGLPIVDDITVVTVIAEDSLAATLERSLLANAF